MPSRTLAAPFLLLTLANAAFSVDPGALGRELRTWYSPDLKYQTEAYLISFDGQQAILEKQSGERVNVAKNRLSAADQEFLAYSQSETGKDRRTAFYSPIDAAFLVSPESAIQWIQRDAVHPEFQDVAQFTGSPTPVVAIAFSGDCKSVAACTADGAVCAWRLAAPGTKLHLADTLRGNAQCIALNPNGAYAFIGCDSGRVTFWDIETGKEVGSYSRPKAALSHIEVASSGRELLAFDKSPALHRVSIYEKKPEAVIEPNLPPGAEYPVNLVGFASDGRLAVVAHRELMDINQWFFASALVDSPAVRSFESPLSQPNALATSVNVCAFSTHMHQIYLQSLPHKPEDATRYVSNVCQVPNLQELRVSSDEQWTIGIAASGEVEIWHNAAFGHSCWTKIEMPRPTAMAISADGRFLAAGSREGTVRIWKLRRLPELPLWRMGQVVNAWFQAERYDLLEELGLRLARETEPFYWDAGLSKLGTFLTIIRDGADTPLDLPKHRDRIKAWRAKYPESIIARLVECRLQIREAWDARGRGFANTVTEEGFRQFRVHLAQASETLSPLIDGQNPPGEAFGLLLEIAKGESWDDSKVEPILDRIAVKSPSSLPAHTARVEMLMPRWGGEAEDCASYAKQVSDRLGGDAGDVMYSRLACALSYYYSPGDFYSETQFEPDRVNRGFLAIAAKPLPEAAPLNIALRLAWSAKDQKNAVVFAKSLMKKGKPVWIPQIWPERAHFQEAFSWATEKTQR